MSINMNELNYLLAKAVPNAVSESQKAVSQPAAPTVQEVAATQSMSRTGLNYALSQYVPTAVEQSQQALSGYSPPAAPYVPPSYTPPSLPPYTAPTSTGGESALEAPVLVERIVASGPTWDTTQEGVNVSDAFDHLRTTYHTTLPKLMGNLEAHNRKLIRG